MLLAACNRAAPAHWLRFADGSGDLSSLNPHLTSGASMDDIAQLTMAYFVRVGPHERIEPELLTVIPTKANGGISRDGRAITWHLRRGVRWSDGAPFDARDVAFSTRAILNPANDETGGTEGWNQIAAVETPSPYTVIFRLKRPYGALVAMAFAPVGGGPCLLPAHLLAALPTINRAPYNALPVGIGPFRIVAWKRGEAIELEANPFYWRGRPKLDRITDALIPARQTLLAQMRTGEIDLWPRVPGTFVDELTAMPHVAVIRTPSLRTTHLDFMMTPGSIADTSVRRAARLAIDRARLIRTVERGQGFLSDRMVWTRSPVRSNDRNVVGFDPALARRLLARDGWTLGTDGIRSKNGRRLALSMPYQSGSPDLDAIVETIRADFRAVGIELEARTYVHAMLFGPQRDGGILENGKFDAVLYSSTLTSLLDLASNVDCAQAPPHGENYLHWCDPRVPAILATMRSSYDESQIDRAFRRLDAIFVNDVPSIQLFVWKGAYATRDRVHGYQDNLLTSFDDMLDADV